MKNIGNNLLRIWNVFIICMMANSYILLKIYQSTGLLLVVAGLFLVVNILPSISSLKLKQARLWVCKNGCELLCLFLVSVMVEIFMHILAPFFYPQLFQGFTVWTDWLIHVLIVIAVEAIVFWNGIIRVYTTSAQLGIKWRVIGIVCGWIPVAQLITLGKIISVVYEEVRVEQEKLLLNQKRATEKICATKYPILLVHGVFFRDFRYFNYWGRIPKELETNGAVIYYGNHQSAASVKESGQEIFDRIQEIVKETGCEKVNIIAHSKGGLDSRYAISVLGAAPYVASLTTINTPHRGCEFADYLLSKVPQQQKEAIAQTYNSALKKLGDTNPDFLAAVTDLTASACSQFNEQVKDVEGVYYQSVGSKLNVATGGRFPLNLTHRFVHSFDGANDGLVGESSFQWSKDHRFLTVQGKRGISHGDMIDLNRENLKEFDVREFYVKVVEQLRRAGY